MPIKDSTRNVTIGNNCRRLACGLQVKEKDGLIDCSNDQYVDYLLQELDKAETDKQKESIRKSIEFMKLLKEKANFRKQQEKHQAARLKFDREKLQTETEVEEKKIAIGLPVGSSKEDWLDKIKQHQENYKS